MKNQNIIERISIPYAEALLGLAKQNNLLLETKQDLSFIFTTLEKSKDLQFFLSNPLIYNEKKKQVLFKLFTNKINITILNFLLVLVDRRRIYLLNTVINKYLYLTYKLESTIVAELFTVIEFNENQQEALISKIQVMTNSVNVKLIIKIRPDLIGGFIIKIGSKIIDVSLAGKLKQMSFYLNSK